MTWPDRLWYGFCTLAVVFGLTAAREWILLTLVALAVAITVLVDTARRPRSR